MSEMPDTIWCVLDPENRLAVMRAGDVETALAVTDAALVPELTELAQLVATQRAVTLKLVEFGYCRMQEITP